MSSTTNAATATTTQRDRWSSHYSPATSRQRQIEPGVGLCGGILMPLTIAAFATTSSPPPQNALPGGSCLPVAADRVLAALRRAHHRSTQRISTAKAVGRSKREQGRLCTEGCRQSISVEKRCANCRTAAPSLRSGRGPCARPSPSTVDDISVKRFIRRVGRCVSNG